MMLCRGSGMGTGGGWRTLAASQNVGAPPLPAFGKGGRTVLGSVGEHSLGTTLVPN